MFSIVLICWLICCLQQACARPNILKQCFVLVFDLEFVKIGKQQIFFYSILIHKLLNLISLPFNRLFFFRIFDFIEIRKICMWFFPIKFVDKKFYIRLQRFNSIQSIKTIRKHKTLGSVIYFYKTLYTTYYNCT